MMRRIFAVFILILVTHTAEANVFSSMVNLLREIAAAQSGVSTLQMDIDQQLKILNGYASGNYGFGMYQFHDYQSYGDGASDWASVLSIAGSGSGAGDLGRMVATLSREFPNDVHAYNAGVNDASSQRYYALKSQTLLAARAASQLDYNKIQQQIDYQQMLQQQIERASNLKAAIDLSNRLQVENNLIALQMLRQSALYNQQQAVSEQASVNSALANARFLTNKKEMH